MAFIPAITWVYIFGISVLSGSEVKGRDPVAATVCLSSVAAAAVLYSIFNITGLLPEKWGLYFCIAWLGVALFFSLRLFADTTPQNYQKTIKWLLLLLVILDGVIVMGARSIIAGFLVFLFILPGGYVAKRFYVT
jgi:hypothetical protein